MGEVDEGDHMMLVVKSPVGQLVAWPLRSSTFGLTVQGGESSQTTVRDCLVEAMQLVAGCPRSDGEVAEGVSEN